MNLMTGKINIQSEDDVCFVVDTVTQQSIEEPVH